MQNNLLMATLRTKANISQVKMAKILNINIRTYKMYECGDLPIKLEDLNKFSNYFNVSLNALLNLTTNLESFNINRDINYQFLAFSLKLIRIKKKLTQYEMAKVLKISVNTWAKLENNLGTIKISYLYFIANKYHVSIDYICGKTLKKEIL